MANEFRDWLERQLQADERLLLGYLCWYSVSEVRVPHDHVVRALVTAGIQKSLPLPPFPYDIFRRVSSKAERKRMPTNEHDVFENFLVRDLGSDDEHVYRRVVGEKVDAKGKKLGYEQLYDVTFNKTSEQITERQLGPTSVVGAEVVETIKQQFVHERGTLNSYKIREWIRHFLLDLNATLVRSGGGVYFVSVDQKDQLDALRRFAAAIKPGNVIVHLVPLVDDRDQREMLREAYEAETSGEIDKLLGEINEIRTSNKRITQARYQEFLSKFQSLQDKTKSYSELLEETLSTTTSRLTIFEKSIFSLLGNVKI